jgi:hypothetical protein
VTLGRRNVLQPAIVGASSSTGTPT